VPKIVVVLKNESVPLSVTNCSGTTTPPNASGERGGVRLTGAG
jgi:hypothetical protein